MRDKYNTNLASEFYVLSMMHRKGIEANLTLGNKKAVDIVIEKERQTLTIDVKGLAAKNSSWPVDNYKREKDHYLVLVCFMGKIENESELPEVYIVPSMHVERLSYRNPNKTRQVIQTGN